MEKPEHCTQGGAAVVGGAAGAAVVAAVARAVDNVVGAGGVSRLATPVSTAPHSALHLQSELSQRGARAKGGAHAQSCWEVSRRSGCRMVNTAAARAADAAVECKAAQAADEVAGRVADTPVCTVDPLAALRAVGSRVLQAAERAAADTVDAARGQQRAGAIVVVESPCY